MKKNNAFLVVIIAHQDMTDAHFYSVLAMDEKAAKNKSWKEFEEEYQIDNWNDWRVIVLKPTFNTTPTKIARFDRIQVLP